MNILATKGSCTDCAACMNICPLNAIQMTSDAEGFPHSRIDAALIGLAERRGSKKTGGYFLVRR